MVSIANYVIYIYIYSIYPEAILSLHMFKNHLFSIIHWLNPNVSGVFFVDAFRCTKQLQWNDVPSSTRSRHLGRPSSLPKRPLGYEKMVAVYHDNDDENSI